MFKGPEKKILIIAGPNGAGKTTFAREFLPLDAHCKVFINADLIAAGLSPFEPERVSVLAGRLMLQLIHEHATRGESFAFETTLAALGFARKIPQWQAQGYRVKMIFLKLPNPEMAIERVAARVAQGGHHIPDATVRRRFRAGWLNFEQFYRPLLDAWQVFDYSGSEPLLLEESP